MRNTLPLIALAASAAASLGVLGTLLSAPATLSLSVSDALPAAVGRVLPTEGGGVDTPYVLAYDDTGRMECPFASGTYPYIVDFGEPLVVLRANEQQTLERSLEVPRGTYDVILASYDVNAFEENPEELFESWYLEFMRGSRPIAHTTPTRDIRVGEVLVVERVGSITIDADVGAVRALHAAYPAQGAEALTPLCAGLQPRFADAPAALGGESASTGGTLVTSTTVYIPPDEASTTPPAYGFAPDAIGVPSALREVVLPENLGIARRMWVRGFEGAPFLTLVGLPVRERAQAVAPLLAVWAGEERSATATPDLGEGLVTTTDALGGAGVVGGVPPVLSARTGMVALRDTDGDGVTDYDELELYGTDPDTPFSGGDVLSDGERILLGLDPRSREAEGVLLQSPRTFASETPDSYRIERVTTRPSALGTSTRIVIEGVTDPLLFITVYLYPEQRVLTVRADAQGRFSAVFEGMFPPGVYELYVGTTNAAGALVAHGGAVPLMVGTSTVELLHLTSTSTALTDAGIPLRTLLTLIGFGLIMGVGGLLVWAGHRPTLPTTQ